MTPFSCFQSSPLRMASVARSEVVEEVPVTSDVRPRPLESSVNPTEVVAESASSQEVNQDVSKERIHPGSSPEKWSSGDLSRQEGLQSEFLHLSPQEPSSSSRQARRQSWRRSSMKGTNRRKSLAPFHQGITELSRSISASLDESKRLGCLLRSSFQFAVEKLEPFLKDTEGFSLESFRVKVSSLSEELKQFTDKLESDGTLQKCFEDSQGKMSDLSLETSVAEMKEYIAKFSSERETWDQLLLHYQKDAQETVSRGSTESKITEVRVDAAAYLGSSQSEVLNSKPDYQNILKDQNRTVDCVELVMDELQGSMWQLRAFMDESTQCLQKVSVQLEKKSTQQLDSSPARKLLKLHLQNPLATNCSGPHQ
ncbi:kinetochore-associated protein DSN1 homolog isoform X2 [Ochotona curzoniae]|uniref:kinetochore-associated protein DSN1 homolog isoform X2 n=1 Tax=Ochotona curzoniae TaxID=130825 RepID=UPI001B353679|nr:kinetochore-associated protein DSN1 homolog isoform X2 [Ochotona curzoniae]